MITAARIVFDLIHFFLGVAILVLAGEAFSEESYERCICFLLVLILGRIITISVRK